jgi:P27 family predicted phage terminase small subunit
VKGRVPKPAELRLREGSYRHDRHAGPLLVGGRPELEEIAEPPSHLPVDAKRFWRTEIRRLAEVGVLDRVDSIALEGLATMYARACQASRAVAVEGHFAEGSRGQLREHPAIKVERESWAMFLRFAEHFALTPVARTRLGLAELEFKRSLQQELNEQLGPVKLEPAD